VPTFQRAASVGRLLAGLDEQAMSSDSFEVIVIGDGSTDGTDELVSNRKSAYRLRYLGQPRRGRASACNAGIRASSGELVILLDDDMQPTSGFVHAHVSAHPRGSRRCVVGAAPIVDPANPTAEYVAQKFNTHLQRLAQPGHRFGLRDFYSGNASIPVALLDEVGLFDEGFTEYGNEDLELSLRLRAAGIELVFDPDAVAFQRWEKDFPQLARETAQKGSTAVMLARKHPEAEPELQLSQYGASSWAWRALRSLLLHATARWPSVPVLVVRATRIGERLGLTRIPGYYRVALDYFYWVGAFAARRAEPTPLS
jgi:glycosyltransferase involved in cell wall biosynthesis